MKICKHCQAVNPDENTICTACGEELDETVQAEEVTEVVEEIVEETAEVEQPKKKTPVWAIIVAVVAVLALVATAVFFIGRGRAEDAPPEGLLAENVPGHHVNAYGYESYSVHYTKNEDGTYTYDYLDENGQTVTMTQEELDALLDAPIATCGDRVLNSRNVLYYYDKQYSTLYNTYGMYMSMLINPELALDEQLSMDGTNTWEQVLLSGGITIFHQMNALSQKAQEEGFELSEDTQKTVDTLAEQMAAQVQVYGFDTIDAYLKEYYGPAVDAEGYLEFCKLDIFANEYITYLQDNMEVTAKEQDEFFDENAETLQNSYGLEKNDQKMVDVRHILIKPEETTAEDGTTSITEEAWAAAEAEAERIYGLWKENPTEDNFATLATEHTTDPGSQQTGGLYEDVYPGQMVTEFNDWCFAEEREVGDTGVVKTSYGYHVMYFSGEGDEVYWRTVVTDMVKNQKVGDLLTQLQDEVPMTADQSKAILLSNIAQTVPTAEEEAPAEEGTQEETPEETPAES